MSLSSQRLVLPGQRLLVRKTRQCPDGRGEYLDEVSRLRRRRPPAKLSNRQFPSARSTEKQPGQKMATRKKSKTSKRTVIEPKKGDRRYVRRNKKGEFKKQVKVGKSLAADRKRKAKTKVEKGQGDRGDVKR